MQDVQAAQNFSEKYNNHIAFASLVMILFLGSILYRGMEIRVAKLDDKCRTVGMSYSFHHGLCVEQGTGRMLDPQSMN